MMTLAATQAALLAGEFLQKNFLSSHQVQHKEGRHNLVTECDIGAEDRILSFLQKQFPTHGFLAEETGKSKEDAEVVWVIDPLDGTVNFAHGIPHFSVSIAACHRGACVVGVVYQPITRELFVAQKGLGAFLQGNRLKVSATSSLDQALLATGFPYSVEKNPMQCINVFSHFLHLGCPIRRLGSAAIDLAYLAAGRFDGYWETGLNPWDVAAGILLVEEAGGKISLWDGESHVTTKPSEILATNALLHPAMIQAIHKGKGL